MKDIGLIDAVLSAYLVAFTFGLNALRARVRGKGLHVAYVAACVLLSVAPFLALKMAWVPHTAITIVLAGIIFFWFAILGARQPHAV